MFGRENGPGRKTLLNGDVYTGNFENGLFSGFGKMELSNGDVFSGVFKDNFKNGEGKLEEANGSVTTGIWEKGQLQEGVGGRGKT